MRLFFYYNTQIFPHPFKRKRGCTTTKPKHIFQLVPLKMKLIIVIRILSYFRIKDIIFD